MPSNRKTDDSFLTDFESMLDKLLQRKLVCCPNCEHFEDSLQRCKLNNMKPPATIIAFGCEQFKCNDIPF